MATDAIVNASSLRNERVNRPVNRFTERIFFGGMAVLLCAVVIIGFSPSYYGAGFLAASLPSPILHIHGGAFTLWMLLYLVQSALISAKRVKWHRSFGTVAFCLPPVEVERSGTSTGCFLLRPSSEGQFPFLYGHLPNN